MNNARINRWLQKWSHYQHWVHYNQVNASCLCLVPCSLFRYCFSIAIPVL
ncbi:hypothetical protein HanXRQr2_Chr16g0725291 [Helianthus annuus]|uniref:Uncharacterized protein n=1 Tax=Helianthus annuus TaxID=4232 RepID=A0A9K3DMN3_HELAN|nr:hypothetical protein HanXRQr2_Chr16g0725291 [Helianthus annuus]